MVCALILWRSDLRELMGKFRKFLTGLSAYHTAIFSFSDDNLSKCQCIFIKLGMSIVIVETWFWIANGQISAEFSVSHTSVFSFPEDNLSKYQWIFTKLGMRIDFVEIWLRITNGQSRSTLAELSAHHTIMARYYHFTFLFIHT